MNVHIILDYIRYSVDMIILHYGEFVPQVWDGACIGMGSVDCVVEAEYKECTDLGISRYQCGVIWEKLE